MHSLLSRKKIPPLLPFILSFLFLALLVIVYIVNYSYFTRNALLSKWPYFFWEAFDDETHLFEFSPQWFAFFLTQACLLWLFTFFSHTKRLNFRLRETLAFILIFSSLVISFIYSSQNRQLPSYYIWLLSCSGAIFLFEIRMRQHKKYAEKIKNLFSSRWNILIITILGTVAFFNKIPCKNFAQFIWTQDYAKYFFFAIEQIKWILHGTLYGWNEQFSGGYPTFLHLRSTGFLMLPFKIFGDILGFKLFIIILYVTGPLLVGWAVYKGTKNKKVAFLSMWFALFLWYSFFGDIFYWGTLPGISSILLFILTFVFYPSFIKQNKHLALACIILFMGTIFYQHPLFFVMCTLYYIFLIIKDRKILFSNRNRLFVLLSGTTLLLICLPKIILLISYRTYIIPTFYYKSTSNFAYRSFADVLCYFIALFSTERFYWFIWIFLPLPLLCNKQKDKIRNEYLIFFSGLLLLQLGPYPLAYRVKFFIVIFLAYFFSNYLIRKETKHFFGWLLLFLTASLFFISGEIIRPSITAKEYFSEEIVQKIKDKKGLLIFENTAGSDPHQNPNPLQYSYNKPTQIPHLEVSLAFKTGKKFLSHFGGDAYPYFSFREGIIAEGTWDGINIDNVNIDRIIKVLRKWEIQSVILFSPKSIAYFKKYPEKFLLVYEDKYFSIFDVIGNSISGYSLQHGEADIKRISPFVEHIKIKDALKNDLLTLHRNYFPQWEVWYDNKKLKIFSHEGLLGFKLPSSGNISLTLKYPKLRWTLLIPLISIFGLFTLAAIKDFY